ncbi:MAG: alpha-amylase family glycosyl hydrolase [Coraliomargaritaceae bacterium]
MNQDFVDVIHVFWETTHSGLLILSADWNHKRKEVPVRFGPDESVLQTIDPLSPEDAGRYCRYFRRRGRWVFRIQPDRYPELKIGQPRVFLAGDFNGWDKAIGKKHWELKPVMEAETRFYEVSIPSGKLSSKKISEFKFVTDSCVWLDVPDSAPNGIINDLQVANFQFNPEQSGQHIFRFQLREDYKPNGEEFVSWTSSEGASIRPLPHTQSLLTASSQLAMGAQVDPGKSTTFSLFSPRADSVQLVYGFEENGSSSTVADLERVNGTTWSTTIQEDLDGCFYSYRIAGRSVEGTSHFDGLFPVVDPYAKACLGRRGPGIVVSPHRLQKEVHSFQAPAWHDLVILEGHVRDFIAHAPIELTDSERKGFNGLRKWLRSEGSYIRELGVNAVELQPIQEFDNVHADEYHWGYMTVNYFSPESSYASDPARASQIEEFRGLVQDFHAQDIAVILDVVYNHVGEPNHLLFVDKYYYFHLDEANDLSNWSGCGNDLRCDTPMGRRLIIDSLKHLIEVYDVDGFRFDLAELIGIDVLREIEQELKALKPSIILIAEPWSFRGHIQDELRETGYASWNDGFRDGIASYVLGEGNQEMIRYFLSGSQGTSRFAAQTINYTESHDDHCWLDRITECADHNGASPTWLDARRTHLMASILFASLGVPMLSAGQDFMRSKQGVSNTYQRGDLNALDYNQRLLHSGTHAYFRSWIQFRLSTLGSALRYDGAPASSYMESFVADGFSSVVIVYNADKSVAAPQLIFGVNPHTEYANIECPLIAEGGWQQIADAERFDSAGLQHNLIPVSGTKISLPPLNCGLWIKQV